jgi:predicted MPP superfamily phosphohydrolase
MFAWDFLLCAGACIGHTAILIFSLNWWYGHGIPHKILLTIRFLHGVLVLAGATLVTLALWRPDIFAAMIGGVARPWLTAYLLICWVIAFLILPIITIRRWLRKPSALLQNHTHTLDIAGVLGSRPIGKGRHRLLASLPLNDIFKVDFAEKMLRLPGLPHAWDGLSVLHISDLHMCGTPDRAFFQEVMERCRTWEPDIVAITGDTVDSPVHHRWLLPVLGRLKWRIGAFAILGNHEEWYDHSLVRRRFRRLGFDVIGNAWRQVDVHGQPLVIIGNEYPWFRPAPDLADCPVGPFRLCLSHSPDNIRWAQRHGIGLMLAGHVHGGQIRLPLIGSVLVPSRFSRRYDAGTFDEPPTVLHVSRGLSGQHPVRYHCRPEVAKLILRPAT